MRANLKDYVAAAFSARPVGMVVPPNWIGLGALALLGMVVPGCWVLAAGLELGYLYVLATNRRFQRVVDGMQAVRERREWHARQEALVEDLCRDDQSRYRDMERRCQSILEQQRAAESAPGVRTESETLARLLWVFLRLLLMRQAIERVLNDSSGGTDEAIEERVAELTASSKKPSVAEELRKSIAGQLEILGLRLERRKEARAKISFLESELRRIEEQVELIREQTVLTTDSDTVSQRVDRIAATLGATSQWIREQQQIYGEVEDLLVEPPPVALQPPGEGGHVMGALPAWAEEMRDLFKSGSVSQFVIHGNIFDLVPAEVGSEHKLLPLKSFLDDVMFAGYDVVLQDDRGRGIRPTRGSQDRGDYLQQFGAESLTMATVRDPGRALELIDCFLLRTLNLQAITGKDPCPRKIAVVIDFAEFVVPRGAPIQLGGEASANIVKILGWANDPAILQHNIVTVLMTEGLHDLNELVVENPHASKLKIPLPQEVEMLAYVREHVSEQFPDLSANCEVGVETLARRLTGLSRVGANTVVSTALKNGRKITSAYLTGMKKDLIERECQGLLEFLESPYTLDNVAGHEAVKAWLRDDSQLLRRGLLHALPMGYLIAGRIGTGKTFIVQCWAGELGIPCVVFKNFRDKWVGATESNLEKIFSILRALGQVVVFVDEADQAAGRRESGSDDSGLSGRVYAMLAKEMSDTRNRGRILWVFATSRPDLLEVDLKRQGRLDVHIPLFPPQTPQEMRDLLLVTARKLKFPMGAADLPDIPEGSVLGGHEVEGTLVRALRAFELQSEPRRSLKDILADTLRDVRPSAHTRKLEYMDLVAVKECTDLRFLPPRYRDVLPEELERRIDELKRFI